MRTIWKFALPRLGTAMISIPGDDVQFLRVGEQDGMPCLWAICDSAQVGRPYLVTVYPTGGVLSGFPEDYIGTFQIRDEYASYNSFFVGHVFIRRVQHG